jgi:2'-5' RNA ligase
MKNYYAQENLYLLSITPPSEIASVIDQERRFCAKRFGSYEALKPPVSLSLFGVFTVSAMVEELTDYLSEWISKQPQFTLHLKDFGFFENLHRPVVYFDVKHNPWLNAFNKGLTRKMLQRFPFLNSSASYHPHLTLAYKDLTQEQFQLAKKYYKQCRYEASFDVTNVTLFKHNHKVWERQREMPLGVTKAANFEFVQQTLFA